MLMYLFETAGKLGHSFKERYKFMEYRMVLEGQSPTYFVEFGLQQLAVTNWLGFSRRANSNQIRNLSGRMRQVDWPGSVAGVSIHN